MTYYHLRLRSKDVVMKHNSLLLVFLLLPTCLFATAQERDLIIYDARVYLVAGASFKQYFSGNRAMPKFRIDAEGRVSTGNIRGYQAIWEIKEDKLYLCGILAWLKEGKEIKQANIAKLFPDQYSDGRVDASWFSGKITLADGKWLQPKGSVESFPEREIELVIVSGRVVQTEIIHHH
jgi:hypothetical protein